MIDIITFATLEYEKSASLLKKKAIQFGFTNVWIKRLLDISDEFVSANALTFSNSRGAGYWLWKPRIILDRLSEMHENEVCLYLDAGAFPTSRVDFFIDLAQDGKIHVWRGANASSGNNQMWTDPTVGNKILGNKDWMKFDHFWAGAILFAKNDKITSIFDNWLELCTDSNLLHPDSQAGYKNAKGQIGHRHDQSLLNCLAIKYPEMFSIHELTMEFEVHRSRWIQGNITLFVFRTARTIYRKILSATPLRVRIRFLRFRTKKNKPGISQTELESHVEYWKNQSE
jgi:hypothetical protein